MAINKKLITFATKEKFLGATGINNATKSTNGYYGNIPSASVVFIVDTGEIWTHGKYYSGGVWGTKTNNYVPFTVAGTTYNVSLDGHTHSQYLTQHQDLSAYLKAATAASTYVKKTGDMPSAAYDLIISPTSVTGSDYTDVGGGILIKGHTGTQFQLWLHDTSNVWYKKTSTGNWTKMDSGKADQLATSRNINGTSFNGTADITTAKWGTSRTITIGNTGKSVNGSADVSWSLSEIGASASSHNHDGRYVYNYANTDCKNASLGSSYMGMTTSSGIDSNWWHIINAGWNGEYRWNSQIGFPTQDRALMYFRSGKDDNSGWGAWKRLALYSEIPSSLKNPNSLTIQTNGTSLGSYDGSSAKTWDITYSNVGAAAASHNHTSLTGVTRINFNSEGSDTCYIGSTVSGSTTTLDFYLADDASQESFRWIFSDCCSGAGLKTIMQLYPTNNATTALKLYDSYVATQDWANSKYLPLSGGTLSGNLNFTGTPVIQWNDGTWHQRIYVTDDSTAGTAVFTFQQSSNSGSSWSSLFTIKDNGNATASTFTASDKDANYVLTSGGTKQWTTSKTANALVARDSNSYIYAAYINSDIGTEDSGTVSYIYYSYDNWIRKMSYSRLKNILNSDLKFGSYLPLSGGTVTGVIYSKYKSDTWVNSLTNSALTLNDASGSYGGWICGPTKDGRIAISTYQGSNNNLYFGYGERNRTTNSFAQTMYWDAPNNTLHATNFSGQWCGYTNDLSTNNTSDTWVPVLTNNTIQHRVIPTAYNSDPSILSVASATKLTTTRSLWGNDFNGDSNVSGRLLINPSNASGNYDEGIRITCNSNGWSTITLKGSDNTSDTGTSTNTWGVFNNNGNFYINKNSSSGQQAPRLWGHSNGWTVGNTSASNYTLSVGGPIYTSDCLKIGDYAYVRSGSGMRINNSDTITSKWATGTIIENRYSEASGIHMDGDGIHMWAADDGLMYYDEDSGDLCWQIDEDGYFNGTSADSNRLSGYQVTAGSKPFDRIPAVRTDGVIELGRYIDLHYDNSGNYDYSTRLQVQGNYSNVVNFPTTSGTLALTSDIINNAQYLHSLGAKNCQTDRTQNFGNVYTYNTNASAYSGAPTMYTSVIGFGQGTAGTVEIAGGWCNTSLYWRALRDCCDNWYSWKVVMDENNVKQYAFTKGMIIIWSGSSSNIPSGWALCNGSNGTPNLSGRFVLGYAGSGTASSVGKTGGSESVTLTTSQMPTHNHDANHRHLTVINGDMSWSANAYNGWSIQWDHGDAGSDGGTGHIGYTSYPNNSSSGFSTGATGGGLAHNNMPPYYVLCYIMYIGS